LKKFRPDIANATPEQITLAAWSTVPNVSLLFWSFRVMVGLGFYFIALFAVAFLLASKRQLMKYRSFL
jgi:cytochrome d ubiquinol oxidase subunit I